MQFKRRRLSAANPFVNVAAGLVLLFSASACSKAEKKTDSPPKAAPIEAGLELPAVWSTRALDGEVGALALSGGSGALLAVALKSGGLQLYNLEAEPVGQPALFRLKALAGGASTNMAGTNITLFPGITRDGDIKGYVFGEGLLAPAEIELPIVEPRSIDGICSGDAGTQGVLQIAYWTNTNNRELRTGMLTAVGDNLEWTPGESSAVEFAITSCVFTSKQVIASPRASSAVALTRNDFEGLVSLQASEGLTVSTDLGLTSTGISIKDGITVKAPDAPTAIAAAGIMRSGGYPGGVIAVAGETAPDEHRVVFVDPSLLTLAD